MLHIEIFKGGIYMMQKFEKIGLMVLAVIAGNYIYAKWIAPKS